MLLVAARQVDGVHVGLRRVSLQVRPLRARRQSVLFCVHARRHERRKVSHTRRHERRKVSHVDVRSVTH